MDDVVYGGLCFFLLLGYVFIWMNRQRVIRAEQTILGIANMIQKMAVKVRAQKEGKKK